MRIALCASACVGTLGLSTLSGPGGHGGASAHARAGALSLHAAAALEGPLGQQHPGSTEEGGAAVVEHARARDGQGPSTLPDHSISSGSREASAHTKGGHSSGSSREAPVLMRGARDGSGRPRGAGSSGSGSMRAGSEAAAAALASRPLGSTGQLLALPPPRPWSPAHRPRCVLWRNGALVQRRHAPLLCCDCLLLSCCSCCSCLHAKSRTALATLTGGVEGSVGEAGACRCAGLRS